MRVILLIYLCLAVFQAEACFVCGKTFNEADALPKYKLNQFLRTTTLPKVLDLVTTFGDLISAIKKDMTFLYPDQKTYLRKLFLHIDGESSSAFEAVIEKYISKAGKADNLLDLIIPTSFEDSLRFLSDTRQGSKSEKVCAILYKPCVPSSLMPSKLSDNMTPYVYFRYVLEEVRVLKEAQKKWRVLLSEFAPKKKTWSEWLCSIFKTSQYLKELEKAEVCCFFSTLYTYVKACDYLLGEHVYFKPAALVGIAKIMASRQADEMVVCNYVALAFDVMEYQYLKGRQKHFHDFVRAFLMQDGKDTYVITGLFKNVYPKLPPK